MAAGQSRPIDRILNIFVSAAAVPVLLGALFKITHAPGADVWLKIGLYTESIIFLGYALLYVFAPPPEAPIPIEAKVLRDSPLKDMDKMLAEADITPANLTNFANWYSYYRTRMLMMKSSAGRAFSTLDASYRVGLMKINL